MPNNTSSSLKSLFNPTPNLTPHDSSSDPGHISLPQKDLFFTYQNLSHNLDPNSLKSSGIIDQTYTSPSNLQNPPKKIAVLDENGGVHTSNIKNGFLNDLAWRKKPEIIDLLFWWELEEVQRLKEREELRELVIGGVGEKIYLELLERVERKIGCRPSQRDYVVEKDEDVVMQRFREFQRSGVDERDGGAGAPPDYESLSM